MEDNLDIHFFGKGERPLSAIFLILKMETATPRFDIMAIDLGKFIARKSGKLGLQHEHIGLLRDKESELEGHGIPEYIAKLYVFVGFLPDYQSLREHFQYLTGQEYPTSAFKAIDQALYGLLFPGKNGSAKVNGTKTSTRVQTSLATAGARLNGHAKEIDPEDIPKFTARATRSNSKFHDGYLPQIKEKPLVDFPAKVQPLVTVYKHLSEVPNIGEIAEFMGITEATIRSHEQTIVRLLTPVSAVSKAKSYAIDPDSDAYMREISQWILLTREEEVELAGRMKRKREYDKAVRALKKKKFKEGEKEAAEAMVKKGDPVENDIAYAKEYYAARKEMIEKNLRLVAKLAHDYSYLRIMDEKDLRSEGNIGLMKAVERFDPEKGNGGKFSTYACWWIKQSMKRAMANQGRDIRLPVHVIDKISKMRRLAGALEEALGREPTDEELAEEMGMDRSKLSVLKRAARKPLSLDASVDDEDGGTEFGEIIGDEGGQDPLEVLTQKNAHSQLSGLLGILDPDEREIIELRFLARMTLEEVGQRFGVTRERIRQRQNIILKKLRRALQKSDDPALKALRDAEANTQETKAMVDRRREEGLVA